MLLLPDLFSTPALSINPADAFEKQQVNVTCTSSEFAAERIGRGDVKYSIYRNSQVLTSKDGRYTTTAGEETSGEYSCSARVKDTVKWSLPVSFTARGTNLEQHLIRDSNLKQCLIRGANLEQRLVQIFNLEPCLKYGSVSLKARM